MKTLDCIKHNDSNSSWIVCNKSDIRPDILDKLYSKNVVYSHDINDDYEIWEGICDGYRITYCTDKSSTLYHCDDLSGIDWENETFYRLDN